MKICFIPFYSQQDKRTGRHMIENDSAFRMYRYMASRCAAQGWEATLAVPPPRDCFDLPDLFGVTTLLTPKLVESNLDKRVHWDSVWLKRIASDFDTVVTSHETYPVALRAFSDKLKIVVEAGFRPSTGWSGTEGLITLARACADAVHCNSLTLKVAHQKRFYWPAGYSAEELRAVPRPRVRNTDVVFCGRASATGYTRHDLFLEAVKGKPYRVVMPDPTSYLRVNGGGVGVPIEPLTRATYLSVLADSRVVVSTIDNGGFPFGLMEAMAMGCVPVVPRLPAYTSVLGCDWRYLFDMNVESLSEALDIATRYEDRFAYPLPDFSYETVWNTVVKDIGGLL